MDIEPEIELSEEEKRAKEKKVMEIKKMIALQSLQPMLNEAVYSNGSNNGGSDMYNSSAGAYYGTNSNGNNYTDYSYEREKRAREQVYFFLLFLDVC